MHAKIYYTIGWLFGILFSMIGLINSFWGNDPFFGVFILVVSLVFYPAFNTMAKKLTGYAVPMLVKILLGLFILWASLGVGELFAKIDLMKASFQ
jgi:hypothetical protein